MVLKKKLIKNNSLARVSCGFSHVFAEAAHRDEEGKVFYGNPTTGETSWEHPLEETAQNRWGFADFHRTSRILKEIHGDSLIF